MRGVRFVLILSLMMLLAGCLGPSTSSWGTGSGSMSVDASMSTVTTSLGDEAMEFANLEPVGCVPDSGELGVNQSAEVSFEGYLAASHFYSSHSSLGGASGLDHGVAASVAIESMSFSQAGEYQDGEGPRIDVKSWDMPLNPDTGTGTADLDEIDQDSSSQWYILGLIPTTENIHEGLVALDEWHQSIRISGYLVKSSTSGNSAGYYSSTYHEASTDCSLSIGSTNKETLFVFVTSVVLEGGTISSDGESNDEWVHGDVPFLGRTGYILFALVVGIGGSIGAFILSKMFVMQGARSSMKVLLGKAGMDTIKQVKKDIKEAKSAGLVSPTERKKEASKADSRSKPPQKSQKSEPALAGFDLDSVLSSAPSMGASNEFGGGASSVVATVESQDMEDEIRQQEVQSSAPVQSSFVPPQQVRSTVTSSQPSAPVREHFTSSAPPSKKSSPPTKKKAVRKRKTTPTRVVEAEDDVAPVPSQPARQTFEEPEEEFSDFSF
ncbi:MAG: hypothetical protein CMA63_03615 [Euryarchaeota archaeon]|nr:hypothetical protein [Euryarchaeota archaeon]|tara:strand:- start:4006 stop:5487 length:1482 start_codon:yes stop_codon:yes gene_type:complete